MWDRKQDGFIPMIPAPGVVPLTVRPPAGTPLHLHRLATLRPGWLATKPSSTPPTSYSQRPAWATQTCSANSLTLAADDASAFKDVGFSAFCLGEEC